MSRDPFSRVELIFERGELFPLQQMDEEAAFQCQTLHINHPAPGRSNVQLNAHSFSGRGLQVFGVISGFGGLLEKKMHGAYF